MFFDFDNLYFTFAVWLHIFLKKWSRERGSYYNLKLTSLLDLQSIGSSPALSCIFVPEFPE